MGFIGGCGNGGPLWFSGWRGARCQVLPRAGPQSGRKDCSVLSAFLVPGPICLSSARLCRCRLSSFPLFQIKCLRVLLSHMCFPLEQYDCTWTRGCMLTNKSFTLDELILLRTSVVAGARAFSPRCLRQVHTRSYTPTMELCSALSRNKPLISATWINLKCGAK